MEEEVKENFWLVEEKTKKKIEIDIFLPKENLAFEYQGQQHYYDIYSLGNLWFQKERDREKKRICENLGIILIEIPYWWNFERFSLMATIHHFASHLIPSTGGVDPIPDKPPLGFREGILHLDSQGNFGSVIN